MRTASCCLVFFIRDCIRFCTNPVSALCRTAFSRRRGRFAFSQSSMRFAPGRPTRMKNNSTVSRPRSGQPGATSGVGLQPAVLPSLAPGRQQQINRRFKCTVFRRRAFVFLRPLMPRGHRLCRTPHAGGALSFLCDQESKQRSRRECDSPLQTPVGSGNRTFPGLQPLSVFRYQCKKSGVLVNRTFLCNGAQPAGNGNELCERAGLRCGRLRPARPKGRKACLDYLTV